MERNYKIGTATEVKHSSNKPPKDTQLARSATKIHEDAQTDSHIKESFSKMSAVNDPVNAQNASATLSNHNHY